MTEVFSPDPEFVADLVSGVVRTALRDSGADGILILAGATPEGELALGWLRSALGEDLVFDGTAAGAWPFPENLDNVADVQAETERVGARVHARSHRLLLAHPACKTVLLLSDWLPPEPLLPLGDLYASAVRSLTGACTLPADVTAFAEGAGGLELLDRALYSWLEQRRPLDEALSSLPVDVQTAVRARLRENRSARRWPRCVPKLSTRTLWIDVFA